MFDLGWVPDWTHPDNILVPFMASYATFAKWQGYGSPELDAKLKAAFEETDPEQQQAKYYELQERYYEDAPSSILWQLLWRCYFTKYIEGYYYNPFVSAFAGLPLYYMSKSES